MVTCLGAEGPRTKARISSALWDTTIFLSLRSAYLNNEIYRECNLARVDLKDEYTLGELYDY